MSRAWAGGSTSAWRRVRRLVLERDGYRCRVPDDQGVECGAYAGHVDHVVARSRGGSDHPDNLRAACRTCNLRRGDGTREGRVVRPAAPAPRWSW